MENKIQTLQVIYELVKKDIKPSTSNIHPNEILSRLHLPWDEIVNHLNALQTDGLIILKQLSVAVINITDKGFQYMTDFQASVTTGN